MGMDVYGKKPEFKGLGFVEQEQTPGAYFRASIWSWPGVWGACERIAPELTSKVQYGYSNDGDGLDADDAKALGERVLAYLDQTGQESFRREPEKVAEFTRSAAAMFGVPERTEDGSSIYATSDTHLREFAQFCIHSGGFEIW